MSWLRKREWEVARKRKGRFLVRVGVSVEKGHLKVGIQDAGECDYNKLHLLVRSLDVESYLVNGQAVVLKITRKETRDESLQEGRPSDQG